MELFFLLLLMILMAAALGSGFPVAFALPGAAIATIMIASLSGLVFAGDSTAFFAQDGAWNWISAGVTNLRGIYWEPERDTLIAIPLFVFMGIMLQRSKIAEDLLVTMAQLFGPVRGGLGISVVFVGALLAATTGIVGATVVAMGLISLPAMMRNNYSNALASGTIAASGTLGQIIPPSIVLIILADQLSNAGDQAANIRQSLYRDATGAFSMPSEYAVSSTSAGEMFIGALVPGLVLVAIYMTYIFLYALVKPSAAPPVPFHGHRDGRFYFNVLIALIPPLVLIFAVLGSIIAGIATVNQAGAIGAAGAMVMAGYRLYEGRPDAFTPAIIAIVSTVAILFLTAVYPINVRDLRDSTDAFMMAVSMLAVIGLVGALIWSGWRAYHIDDTLNQVMMETAKTSALVFIILLGAAILTAAFRAFGGEELVREFLIGLPGGFWGQFITVMLVMFILGFFLDFIEIAVVVVPIVAPILLADPSANVTAVWLGVMIGLNLQTSFLTPPFGFALFYLRGVAPPEVRTLEIYRGVVPFIGLQLLALGIVAAVPELVNYLPTRLSLLAETAPPPRNPRLQQCIEEFLSVEYESDGPRLRRLIADARALDLSALPEDLAEDLTDSFDQAEAVFDAIAAANAASADLGAALPAYLPVLRQARSVERGLMRLEAEVSDLTDLRRRTERFEENPESAIARIDRQLEHLAEEKVALEGAMPPDWPDTQNGFRALITAETRAWGMYRRAADQGYEPLPELIAAIEAGPLLSALERPIAGLSGPIADAPAEEAQAAIIAMEAALNELPQVSAIRTPLSRARRALRGDEPDREAALTELSEAEAALAAEVSWRTDAADTIVGDLKSYEAGIRDTIGLRQQDRMPREIALSVAGCRSSHKDISHYF